MYYGINNYELYIYRINSYKFTYYIINKLRT